MADPETFQFEQREVQVKWPDDLGSVTMGNVFNVQITPDGIILTIGQGTLPLFMGTAAEQIEKARKLRHIDARVVGRVLLTTARAEELVAALGSVVNASKIAAAQQREVEGTRVQ